MQGKDRPPAFMLYARDILSSTAWSVMTPEQRGGYCALLFHAWLADRPGWLRDDDATLSALSGLAQRWLGARLAISKAFRVRKGWWVQTRMVQERKSQWKRSGTPSGR